MTKQPGPPPQPVAVYPIRLESTGLVVGERRMVPPHLRDSRADTAIDAMKQRMPVRVDDATLERVKEALQAQGVNV